MTMPPNWYDNPDGSPSLRWWDGQQWTEQQRPRPSTPPTYLPPYPLRPTSRGFAELFRQDAKFSRNLVLAAIGVLVVVVAVVALSWDRLTGKSQWRDYGYEVGKSAAQLVRGGMGKYDACETGFGFKFQFEGVPEDLDYAEAEKGCMDAIRDAGYR